MKELHYKKEFSIQISISKCIHVQFKPRSITYRYNRKDFHIQFVHIKMYSLQGCAANCCVIIPVWILAK